MPKSANGQSQRVAAGIRKLEPKVQAAFVEAIRKAAASVDLAALGEALEARDLLGALELLRMDQSAFFPLRESVRSSYLQGANVATESLALGLAGKWSFDGTAAAAQGWIERRGADLVDGIVEETLKSARLVISKGLADGVDHKKMARQIVGKKVGRRRAGGFIGLDSKMTDDVLRAREILSDPERIQSYFVRDRQTGRQKPRFKLSDRRYDARVRAAIREGRALKGADLDRVIEAHKNKALAYRGRRIAKNEAHTALAAGREEAYSQVISNPDVEAITVRWQHGLSQEPREDHAQMDGTVIDLGQTFEFPDGTQMRFPHDPAGGAKHSIGCRCMAIYRVRMRKQ